MIKNIIFDFGDIFIDLNKTASIEVMKSYGLIDVSDEMDQTNKRYEKGSISTKEFISFYQDLFPNVLEENLIAAWNAIILFFPEHRLEFMETLAKDTSYRLFLLSNTNELHINKVKENMGIERYRRFEKCFEKFYLSHEIHLRKPDKEIYNYVLGENKLIAEETLFIDDTKENTIAVTSLGIKTWNLVPENEDVIDLFTINKTLFN